MEIRVAVADAAGVHGLVRRLAGVCDGSAVSCDGPGREVRVRSEWERRKIALVLHAVQAWLAEDGVGSADVSIGDRSYTMVGPAPTTSGM